MLINSLILFVNGVRKVGIELHCLLSKDWRTAAQTGKGCEGHSHGKSQEATLILWGIKSYLATHTFLLSPLCFCFKTKQSAPSRRPWLKETTWAGEGAQGVKVLVTKPATLTSIPRTYVVDRKIQPIPTSCPLTSICELGRTCKHTHMPINIIKKYNPRAMTHFSVG